MNKPFIVAEMSCNHLGSYERAVNIVHAASFAGADAIKFQVWKPDTMCLDHSYTIEHGPWAGWKLVDLYRDAHTPWEWLPSLFAIAQQLGLVPFASPFDRESVDYLQMIDCPMYKIASFELVDLDLISYAAKTGKPMIMSIGMAERHEVARAFTAARQHTNDVTLLKCTSAYPADASDANLATLDELAFAGASVGISDHSPGIGVAVAAVARGATMVEKHLTLARADGGHDAGFSMEPGEFKHLVEECRRAAAAVGRVTYGPQASESTALRRSLWFCRDLPAGHVLTDADIRTARPALGLPCDHLPGLIGTVLTKPVASGQPVTMETVQ